MAKQNEHPKKRDMLEALVKTLGVVTPALEKANVSRSAYYEWLKKDDQFNRDVRDIESICLDFSESKLHILISDGNPAAIFFHLKCKGKKRGYIERQELEQTIQVEHTGKVVTYRLPDNGRDPELKKEKESDGKSTDSNQSDS